MAIQKQFLLRYRGDGHVRFQLPVSACQAEAARQLTLKLSETGGVRSVRLYRNQRKLSIRYNESVCGFNQLAVCLYRVVAELEQQGLFETPLADKAKKSMLDISQRFKQTRVGGWFREKYQAGRETLQAAKIVGKLGVKGPKALIKDPEKATIDFLNDVLVLYLIKTHWTRITQEWLVRPFVHRYEWMALFYMFFLLVRSRRPK
ncbi:hypothetical protein PL263_08110 [Methylomonas sp. EFPC3]|uniref:hypothetical protein n=1 Tax=Methylomonas TaxID=416 RepID=UPI001125D41F|nr:MULTISPECIES: hypothetical protein [Methylomonas]TPQ27015.1 hypothetical protein C2U68_10075 [Methylomonas koyamae]WFP51985.1 hypothetical protein PL263_08110 [Methylomonas sp. EFPC3]